MSKPFFITGLPRSRTAWFAVAATTDDSMCHHEPTTRFKRWEDCFVLWRTGRHHYTGISDNSLGFHIRQIIAEAAPRVLIIDRDIEEVEASLDQALGFPRSNYCALLRRYLDYTHPLIKRVAFDDLADGNTVVDCLEHLMPDLSFDLDRVAMLRHMNIQTDIERVKRLAVTVDPVPLLGASIVAQLRAV